MEMEGAADAQKFPPCFPPRCPLDGSEPADGVVFRCTQSNPPQAADFLTYHEDGCPLREPVTASTLCKSHGISVFRVLEHAIHRMNLFPGMPHFIARGILTAAHGVTKQTGKPSHTTWWAYDGVVRHEGFVTVETR
ncbi:MAG: hypothetical protein C0467_15850 [Planctomycetaceae bacterium]|nr:hypothetical protein [Planctomycetaceae bacterium]